MRRLPRLGQPVLRVAARLGRLPVLGTAVRRSSTRLLSLDELRRARLEGAAPWMPTAAVDEARREPGPRP